MLLHQHSFCAEQGGHSGRHQARRSAANHHQVVVILHSTGLRNTTRPLAHSIREPAATGAPRVPAAPSLHGFRNTAVWPTAAGTPGSRATAFSRTNWRSSLADAQSA